MSNNYNDMSLDQLLVVQAAHTAMVCGTLIATTVPMRLEEIGVDESMAAAELMLHGIDPFSIDMDDDISQIQAMLVLEELFLN